MSDDEIITLIKQRSHAVAVRKLYGYLSVVKKYVRRNSGNTSDAEDVFQDALVILFKKVDSGNFQLNSTLNTFLFGICKNLWNEELRKRKKADGLSMNKSEFSEEMMHETVETEKAVQAIASLGEKCRLLLHLFYYKKMSMADIASYLSLSGEKGARSQKYKCLEKARKFYLTIK